MSRIGALLGCVFCGSREHLEPVSMCVDDDACFVRYHEQVGRLETLTERRSRTVYDDLSPSERAYIVAGSSCEICGDPAEHLDHDHATGFVRGPLCRDCNLGLGRFRDSVELFDRAIRYLHRTTYRG